MKKIIVYIMILLLFLTPKYTYASECGAKDETHDIIQIITSHIEPNENKSVSRGECVAAIMKLIGMNQNASDLLNYDTDYDQSVYLDECDDEENRGYIIQAIWAEIAFGVKKDWDGRCYFAPQKDATIKECVTFMLRCLRDYTTVDWNSNIISSSEEIGLLSSEESENINDVLTTSMFNTLLKRMLNMNRYLYWQPKDNINYPRRGDIQVDQTNSMKYIDYFLRQEAGET